MAGQFIEAPLEIQKQKPPKQIYDNCKAQNIPTEGNAAGFFNLENFEGLTPSPEHRIAFTES